MTSRPKTLIAFVLVAALAATLALPAAQDKAEPGRPFDPLLTVERIFAGREFAAKRVPPGAAGPLAIEDYAWSPDGKVLIVFTNSKRVWRQNTRGDFWVFDLASGRLRQLGLAFEPSTLMFAKLSPHGRRAAYVVKNDIYAEDLSSGR